MIYNIELIVIFFAIYFLDNISIYLNKLRFGDKEVHDNLIHSYHWIDHIPGNIHPRLKSIRYKLKQFNK